MFINYFSLFYINSDLHFMTFLFNYNNFILKNNYIFFNVEIILILYIIYNIFFFNTNKIEYKHLYFNYILFIVILFFLCLINIIYLKKSILYCNLLLSNQFVLFNKFFILFSFILILFIMKNKLLKNPKLINLDEIFIFFSFLILFIFILFSTYDFFLIYLAIEGVSLILYTLSSIMSDSLINLEAIIKYFIINNLASTILLWSISYIYIFTGTTDGFEIKYILSFLTESVLFYNLQFIFIIFIISFLIKLAIFPFSWWIADIFDGFWTPVTLIYAVLIKYTYFIIILKLMTNIFSTIILFLIPYLVIASLGSVIIGSIAALTQTKLKRFLGYTSISQAGYILLGISCNNLNGFLSSFLYLLMYCLITLSFFCILLNTEHIQNSYNIIFFSQLHSLFIFNKEITWHTTVIIFIMAAIPPFTSFFAKISIFYACIEAKLEIILILFLIISLISTFYYLNLIQQLLFYKLTEYKIYFYNENFILNNILRVNNFFFIFGIFFVILIYNLAYTNILFCLYPLSI